MQVQVAVEAAVYAIDKPYSYRLPDGMQVAPGMRVSVPFGRGNRLSEAIVLTVSDEDGDNLKCVSEILDTEPLLDAQMLNMAVFLRERYFCTLYDAIKAMLPTGLWFRAAVTYQLAEDAPERKRLSEQQKQILDLIESCGGTAEEAVLRRQFGEECRTDLQSLLRMGHLQMQQEMQRKTNDQTERLLSLAAAPEEAVAYAAAKKRRAPMQAAVLELLAVAGMVSRKEVCYFTGASSETIKRLVELGYVTETKQEVLRTVVQSDGITAEPIRLNAEQQSAYDGLRQQMAQKKPGVALLHGITGSGKTVVYLSLIQSCLEQGKSAMLLVPEISLTPQLIALLTAHFGKRVAVLHSRLRMGARYDEWKRIRRGEATVVVGTRSAVFAPLHHPGLFILDEEHEHSYKSENTPRYHAREVAIYRGHRADALVLLGSATPSIESMYRARSGVYTLFTLHNRYNGKALPKTEIIDLKQELREGNGSPLSRRLQEALRDNQDKQAILFLNRRGSSRMLVCVDCGFLPQCPNCSVNLTYHQANGRLMCHYCGYSVPVPNHCPTCGGHLKMVGFGTQRIQTELEQMFPGQEILRMDADTITATNSHEMILRRFREERIPVLVGTQMVTKGLNFEHVTLVGVLDADAALYVDHFRAAETAFSMITQVVGRSGRGSTAGIALIQTMTPEHPVIQAAARQDYDYFYTMELPLRQLRGCPPFSDLYTLTFSGVEEAKVEAGALYFRGMLQAALPNTRLEMRILGPAPAPVARVSGRYRYRLTLGLHNSKEARNLIAYLLRCFLKDKTMRGVSAFADINSYE